MHQHFDATTTNMIYYCFLRLEVVVETNLKVCVVNTDGESRSTATLVRILAVAENTCRSSHRELVRDSYSHTRTKTDTKLISPHNRNTMKNMALQLGCTRKRCNFAFSNENPSLHISFIFVGSHTDADALGNGDSSSSPERDMRCHGAVCHRRKCQRQPH